MALESPHYDFDISTASTSELHDTLNPARLFQEEPTSRPSISSDISHVSTPWPYYEDLVSCARLRLSQREQQYLLNVISPSKRRTDPHRRSRAGLEPANIRKPRVHSSPRAFIPTPAPPSPPNGVNQPQSKAAQMRSLLGTDQPHTCGLRIKHYEREFLQSLLGGDEDSDVSDMATSESEEEASENVKDEDSDTSTTSSNEVFQAPPSEIGRICIPW